MCFDLNRAFDTVDHSNLLEKLSHDGIRGIELEWFKFYLCGRKQSNKVNGHLSNIESIRYGLPQGSCLGLLMARLLCMWMIPASLIPLNQ